MFKGCYSISVKGCLDTEWSQWFSGWSITHPDPEITLLRSGQVDQSALHGVIQKIRDLNLPIISVNRVECITNMNPLFSE